jgi:hypothetical protein
MLTAEYKLGMISKYINGIMTKNPTLLLTDNSPVFAQSPMDPKKNECPPLTSKRRDLRQANGPKFFAPPKSYTADPDIRYTTKKADYIQKSIRVES